MLSGALKDQPKQKSGRAITLPALHPPPPPLNPGSLPELRYTKGENNATQTSYTWSLSFNLTLFK